MKVAKCKICSKDFQKYRTTDKYCSPRCLEKAQAIKIAEKKKKAREAKKISISALSKKADALWSLAIRSIGACEYCGSKEHLNAHHIFSRHNKNVRWILGNGICLCAKHHTFSNEFSAHKTPTEFTRWLESGSSNIDHLAELAHTPRQITVEYLQERIAFFNDFLKK